MIEQQGSLATPRLDLAVAMEEYLVDQGKFIALDLFPTFETQKKTATVSVITRESMTVDEAQERAPGTDYARGTTGAKDITFNCTEKAIEHPVDDVQREVYANSFSADMVASKAGVNKVLIKQERSIAAKVFNEATFTAGNNTFTDVSATPWATAASDIKGHVDAAKDAVRLNCGIEPDTMTIGPVLFRYIKNNTALIDSVKYTARVTDAELVNALADYFGLRRVLVGKASYNSANPGQAFSGSDIWQPTHALLSVSPELAADDLSEATLGRTFLWTEDSPENVTIETYREEQKRSTIYRVRQHTDEFLVDAFFGHLLKVAA